MDPGTIIAVIEASARVLSLIAKYYSDVKKAKEDIESLRIEIEAFSNVLRNIQLIQSSNAAKLPLLASLAPVIRGSLSDIENLQTKLDPGKGKKAMRRVGFHALQWPFTKKEVEEHVARLEGHKTTLTLALTSDHTSLILGIDENVSQLQQGQDLAEQDRQLEKLLVADDAAFDSYYRQHEPQCVQNTRVDLLDQVQTWNTGDEKCIFWLTGMAGTGKSTIARSVACAFEKKKRLGASFFFSRGVGDLGHATRFVSTLAHQLASRYPELKQHVSQAIADHNNITRQGLRNQWNELILKPLSMLKTSNSSLTLVVDALDECERDEDIKLILQLFVKVKDLVTVKLKIFLTSRPEKPIRLGFQDMPEILHQHIVLHGIPRSIVEHDLEVCLRNELGKIRKDHNLHDDWPGDRKINRLVERSDCLFIYIATACRFIGDPNWRPQERLSLILESSDTGFQHTAELDGMYMQILRLPFIRVSGEEDKLRLSERFRRIVGSIVTLFDVLSTIALAGLLSASVDVSTEDISLTLDPLHSVLNIPGDEKLPIRLLHPSFRDFLVNDRRCEDNRFCIDQELVHMELAESCLQLLLRTLKRNMCNLQLPGTLIHEVQYSEVDQHLSKDVQYACRYWVDHLERVGQEKKIKIGLHDDGQIHTFLLKHILHWLEALSLMGIIPEGVLMITRLEAMLEPNEQPALKTTIYDAKRFILSNRQIIEEAPLQLYNSALVFCPNHSVTKTSHSNELPTYITRYPAVEDNWSSLLLVLEGHRGAVTAVAFSNSGRFLASASFDWTVRLWNATTGTLQSTLKGHTGPVTSVAFSSNDQLLASASYDQTIRLWDLATGTLQSTLEGHTSLVMAVAFSSNGQLLASASVDQTVRLWDPTIGRLRSTLEGHTDEVHAVAFSGDGKLLASASRDKTIRLWDLATGSLKGTLEGHTDHVNSVAFSGGNQLLASASDDQTIRLWDSATGTLRSTLEGHTGNVNTVAFSGNDQILASGSSDQTIRLWDFATETLEGTLKSDTSSIYVMAFSGDSQLLASSSNDNVRLWDPAATVMRNTLEGHTDRVGSVVFSGDGQLLASASFGQSVRLWDPATGALQSTLEFYTTGTIPVVFSSDSQLMASLSWDHTIQLWNPATGTLQTTLKGHTDLVIAMALSSDSQLLASASWDKTIRLWDLVTGTLQSILEGHTAIVTAVAFSSNGQLLASGSCDKTIRLWDPATGTLQSTLECTTVDEGDPRGIMAVAFSSNGQFLASAYQQLQLWDPATGMLRSTLEGHTDRVNAVAFSSDNQLLASASWDHTVRLWDSATGNLIQQFEAGGVQVLSFSSDQMHLETNVGSIQLSHDADSTSDQSSQSRPWMIQRNWLTWNGHKVLWLPPDIRPWSSANRGSLFVFGGESGRVTFLELQANFNPKTDWLHNNST